MRAKYIILLLWIFLQSCTTLYFGNPQPKGVVALNAFPKKFQGAYLVLNNEGEQDTILVEENKYTYPETFEKYISLYSIDSLDDVKIVDGLLYDQSLPTKNGIPYTIQNDTLHYSIRLNISNALSDSFVLKKQGRFLVFNIKEGGDDYWTVYLIEKLKTGYLALSTIGNFKSENRTEPKLKYDGRIEDFYSITTFKALGKNTYLINPTRKEFKKLVKKGLFVKLGEYEKVSVK